MYAIVEIAGKQFRVQKDARVKVPLLQTEPGAKVVFDRVLLYENEKGETQIGTPVVAGLKISATVVEHGRDKKVIVFKKKRRKGYQKKNGHRQGYSVVSIDEIGLVKAAKKAAAKAEVKTANAQKTEVKKTAPKKAAAKKTTAKPQSANTASKANKEEKPAEKKEA